jgi:hypothetical protein
LGQFWSLLGAPFGSQAFLARWWTRLGSVLVAVASWGLYMTATPSHMGAKVDGQTYYLQRPPAMCHLVLSLLIGGGAYRGEETSWGVAIR